MKPRESRGKGMEALVETLLGECGGGAIQDRKKEKRHAKGRHEAYRWVRERRMMVQDQGFHLRASRGSFVRTNGLFCEANGLFWPKDVDLPLMLKGFVNTSWPPAPALQCLCGVRLRSLIEARALSAANEPY